MLQAQGCVITDVEGLILWMTRGLGLNTYYQLIFSPAPDSNLSREAVTPWLSSEMQSSKLNEAENENEVPKMSKRKKMIKK